MNRRQLLKGCVGLGCAGLATLAPLQNAAAADDLVPYTPEVYAEALASGEPFMLDFYAAW